MALSDYKSMNSNGLYTNLLRKFVEHGEEVFVLSPVERRNSFENKQSVIYESGSIIVKFTIGNIRQTNLIEKGISTMCVVKRYIAAINEYFPDVKFDLILYPTPPITLWRAVEYVKQRDGAKTYLLLKDIFPQNAVDIGILKKNGIRGVFYRYFRNQEKKLYAVSDYIGCMSQANVEYIRRHNPELNSRKIEICPNAAESLDMSCSKDERIEIRNKYGIPLDRKVFIYGGNLGKPQGIPHLVKCLKSQMNNRDAFFLIIGKGTEFKKLQIFFETENPSNMKLFEYVPKEEYDAIVGACDVGMIFLDHRFTIPNFPSRLLPYLQAKIPVLACTDPNTDIGEEIVNGGFGWWCESDTVDSFSNLLLEICNNYNEKQIRKLGEKGHNFLKNHYNTDDQYKLIISKINKESFDLEGGNYELR